jgi:hypothetical protein
MYSKHDVFIKDSSGNTNELNTDGSFPSEFEDRSSYCGMDNDCDKRQTECLTKYANDPKKNDICSKASVDKSKANEAAVEAAAKKKAEEERAKLVKDLTEKYTKTTGKCRIGGTKGGTTGEVDVINEYAADIYWCVNACSTSTTECKGFHWYTKGYTAPEGACVLWYVGNITGNGGDTSDCYVNTAIKAAADAAAAKAKKDAEDKAKNDANN